MSSKKIALMTTTCLDGVDGGGSGRFERTLRWMDWHWSLRRQGHLEFDHFILVDNGSDLMPALRILIKGTGMKADIVEEPRIEGGKFQHDYPYCWRGIFRLHDLMMFEELDKVIFLDNDGYLLSNRICDHVNGLSKGWEASWCRKYGFPESAFHVLCRDSLEVLSKFIGGNTKRSFIDQYNGSTMEHALPFTIVNKDFVTDRFGESREPQRPDMDYYGQAPTNIASTFDFQEDK